MNGYDHKRIEKKWQRVWAEQKLYQAKDRRFTRIPKPQINADGNQRASASYQRSSAKGRKFYALIEFPYPSGDGLHVGHPRPYIGMDIIARKRRMEGYNVLYPIGWDAFGLPTENYALKTGIHPAIVTKRNAKNFKRQIQSLGISFDWSREINTTDPKYYRWTQWLFLQFFKHGLAYKKKMPINWCLSCKIGLANEEVADGKCERCGGETEKREKEQWMLAITKYADRLDKDLDMVDFAERIKTQQRNWIGRSEGSVITFALALMNADDDADKRGLGIGENQRTHPRASASVEVFTTRADTLFGATYLVLAPEHPFVQSLLSSLQKQGTSRDSLDSRFRGNDNLIENSEEVKLYINGAKAKTEMERTTEGKEKTGVELQGIKAINPANGEKIPVWIADYVLAEYGTGAIMAVPAHDQRDFEFAQKYQLPIRMVICSHYPAPTCPVLDEAYLGEGHLVGSGTFIGLQSEEAKKAITESVGGKIITKYKLRDWVFSRQRYWGEPIPLVFCEECKKRVESTVDCSPLTVNSQELKVKSTGFSLGERLNPGWVAVPDDKLPVKLPNVQNYKPTENGESPLAAVSSWVNVKCPKCRGPAKRETDTMPNWAGSSWYYLRYLDPSNAKHFVGRKRLAYWCGVSGKLPTTNYQLPTGPVDWYNGGMEHTTLHLLYSRFWHKFLYDLKLVPTPEPYAKRTSHGLILAEGGEKMSKSKGNVVNPDDIVKRFGADSLRIYEMFMGPFEQAISWSTDSLVGARRFLERIAKLKSKVTRRSPAEPSLTASLLNQTIKKVSDDIESMKFNTAISALMILLNALEKEEHMPRATFDAFLKLLAPFAPHLAEELFDHVGHKKSIHLEPWPAYNEAIAQSAPVTIIVQVNGKTRGSFTARRGEAKERLEEAALSLPAVKKWTAAGAFVKAIVVPDRLVNIVVRQHEEGSI